MYWQILKLGVNWTDAVFFPSRTRKSLGFLILNLREPLLWRSQNVSCVTGSGMGSLEVSGAAATFVTHLSMSLLCVPFLGEIIRCWLDQWFSARRDFASLGTSVDVWSHFWVSLLWSGVLLESRRVGFRDNAKHPTVLRTILHKKELSCPWRQ